jgi:hypothetical protein
MAAVAPAIADCSPLRWPPARRRRALAVPPRLKARVCGAASDLAVTLLRRRPRSRRLVKKALAFEGDSHK